MEEEENYRQLERKDMSAFISIIIYVVLFTILSYALFSITYVLMGSPKRDSVNVWQYILMYVPNLLSAVVSAVLLLKYYNLHPVEQLGLVWRGHGKDFLWGLLVAALLFGVGFGVSCALGVVEVTGIRFDGQSLVVSFLFFVMIAFTEEIMVRGFILGRLLQTRMNKFLSLFISSVLFAMWHIFNPNMAFLPMLNLVLAGCLLGSTFIYTRNLWFPISLHLFWNWIQGSILGYQVSGNVFSTSVLQLYLPENNIVNGGTFGFEGSIICTVLVIVITGLIIWYFEKKEKKTF